MQSVFENSLKTLVFKSEEMSKIDHIFIGTELHKVWGNKQYIAIIFVSCDRTKVYFCYHI